MKSFSEKQAGILNSADLKSAKGKAFYWIMFGILVLVCITTIVPTLWMILSAFKTSKEMYTSISFFPKNFTISGAATHLAEAWNKLKFGRSMINTMIVAAGNALVSIVICGMAGFVLSKKKVEGTKLVFVLTIWTMMLPSIIRTVPQYMSYISFPFVIDDKWNYPLNINILDTYLPLWLGAAANSFNIILFMNNFDTVSPAIMEAAMIDGCSTFKIFYKIMLPIVLPVVVYVCIGAFNSAWSDYFTPYLTISNTDLLTTPAKLFMKKSDTNITANVYITGLMFSCIPPAIFFCIFQKYIIGGIAVGGVKG